MSSRWILAPLVFLVATLFVGGDVHAASAHGVCKLANAPGKDFELKVPFDVVDGRIYVQARVNGHGPYQFAVDTGASGWGRADVTLVSALHLKTENQTTTSDGVQTARVATVRFDSLELGGLSRKNLTVIARDYDSRMSPDTAFSGIIGREFFGDGLLIINYPERTLSFSRKLALSPTEAHVLGYQRAFRVPVSIGSVQTEGNLDTGANVTFVLPKSLYKRVSDAPLQQAGRGRLTNSRIETMRSMVRGPFRIGGVTLSNVPVRVSDHYPELLIGAHALQHFVVMIDQRSKSIALCN
ncbi:MAG: aspartyl protease family protein [Rhodanobacteraceae bacterium]